MDAPGQILFGTSDALNTNLDLMFVANPDIKKVGLLFTVSLRIPPRSRSSRDARRIWFIKVNLEYSDRHE